ncbi:peptide chain release factor 3 [Rhodospirillum rubrum]|uniref:Peptide chain release factor 3 n=1 Tax=Rhodospirillum rubrum (strain ATCC 11170 / ATH 1.1.1 / DSM 467 / LMG 4362 / NCIMB 8255 / S1) TaxID=269796 RepID=Q2RRE8_RHORT|nr:peptide chain release factor 3 [Rhodospirillum rubrum]ABC23297.1 bacterial peptide chain release factor 3 (bRF-3) [Rhodospirillum rubrum ATCC 11170]AEO49029.1 peptide chain release factor 3 [Rhodospirillum rubrum F11]MBK5954912.1 peptide chain release factor 3 [Rhodospirillum rubrum]QXG79271.1 peptide chain release factor 3 [Rhodospirillum rubrum]
MTAIEDEVQRRRTFAIISHPDAGKTTLTEKLLLFGGAIQLAGAVKARGEVRRARSDWMKVEQERGISVASSVMSYEYAGRAFNLLDTPGHEDFSEDTYRTLTAVDSAVMVIDAAKGIEEQTRKLFEVCRLRDVPIITFINKLDREGQDPFDLLDEIEQTLALDVTPASWPIGMGRDFLGCYDLFNDRLALMAKGAKGSLPTPGERCEGLDDPKLDKMLPADAVAKLRGDVEMVRGLCPAFDAEAYRAGTMTPVFFGSAVNNFGVRELLEGVAHLAPSPRPQPTTTRDIQPTEDKVTGFVFKIQANMDPKHRDRIAFVRLCSGPFRRGMKLFHVRTGKQMNMHNPVMFLARERELAEEAFAGDIMGVPNHGQLRIGDTLSEGENLRVTGIPSFAPEMLQKVRPKDPLRAKHLGRALQQIAEEGAARVFKPIMGADWIVGVVGPLQFEVLADRIRTEFDVPVLFESTALYTARWVTAEDPLVLKKFLDGNQASLAEDHDGDPVFLARNAWHLDRAAEDFPLIVFHKTKEQAV